MTRPASRFRLTPFRATSTPFRSCPRISCTRSSDGAVNLVRTTADTPAIEPLAGPLGQGAYSVDALAVSVTNTDLAVTTDGRTTLRRAPIPAGEPSTPTTLLSGATDLLRPQFTRYGEIWAIGRQGGRQRMWMSTSDKPVEVTTPVLRDRAKT